LWIAPLLLPLICLMTQGFNQRQVRAVLSQRVGVYPDNDG
jgi:hypothetical protein